MGSICPCHSTVMSRVIPDCPGDVLQQPLVQGVQSVHVTEQLLYDLLGEGLVVASLLPYLWQQGLQAHNSHVHRQTYTHMHRETQYIIAVYV